MGYGPPVTLQLSIPKNFDRVTFEKEFYGRRFVVVDHRPVTEMPWLPGEQELTYTYRVPLVESAANFAGLSILPSSMFASACMERTSGLCRAICLSSDATGGQTVFATAGEQLKRDSTIEVQIASLPFPWMQYARWGSVVLLAVLVGATVAIPRLRRRRSTSRAQVRQRPIPKPATRSLSGMCYCLSLAERMNS